MKKLTFAQLSDINLTLKEIKEVLPNILKVTVPKDGKKNKPQIIEAVKAIEYYYSDLTNTPKKYYEVISYDEYLALVNAYNTKQTKLVTSKARKAQPLLEFDLNYGSKAQSFIIENSPQIDKFITLFKARNRLKGNGRLTAKAYHLLETFHKVINNPNGLEFKYYMDLHNIYLISPNDHLEENIKVFIATIEEVQFKA